MKLPKDLSKADQLRAARLLFVIVKPGPDVTPEMVEAIKEAKDLFDMIPKPPPPLGPDEYIFAGKRYKIRKPRPTPDPQ